MSVDFWCAGASEAPDPLNVANGNAAIVTTLLGYGAQPYGDIHDGECAQALDHVREIDVELLIRPTVKQGNMTFCGAPREQIERYRTRLIVLLQFCIDTGANFLWG